jgi:flavodoxin I
MATIGLFYGTETGNTRKVGKMIVKEFGGEDVVKIHNVAKATATEIEQYNCLIFGMPTLGDGEMENSFKAFLEAQLNGVDLSSKTVALYGLGDQNGYGHEFLDGMAFIYEKVKEKGAKIVGSWSTEGYEFTKSKALLDDDNFFCLAIDEDNQADETKSRVKQWVAQIRPDFGV